MDKKIFEKFRGLVYENSGIHLNDTKEAMVSSRIAKRMRILGISDYKSYLQFLLDDESGDEITKFLDVISTNVTSFFREPEHFEFLGDIAAQWIQKGNKRIRIWSAAASTGEEPYSIAMTLLVATGEHPVNMRILATDISTNVLLKAQEGIYSSSLMVNIPESMIKKYFVSIKASGDQRYIARDVLKNLVVFRRLNLSQPPFPMTGRLDMVFCRNVMIYFDNEVRTRLITEIFRLLNPGGYLITGHAESLSSLKTDFKCLRPSIYQKVIT